MSQHKQSISDFIKALSDYVQNGMSGSIVFMGRDESWGKIVIEAGSMVSITYGIYRGPQVLPQLKSIEDLRFMFRPDKAGAKPTNPGSAAISNEDFFRYFGLKVPRVSQESSGESKANVQSIVANNAPTISAQKSPAGTNPIGKVLIIDDSSIARRAASDPLIERGYEIIEAKDGFEALAKLELEVPDVIILDLIMPGIDGYKVVELLKRNDKFKNIPIILVTSKDSLMDKLKGKMSNTDAYITKPFKEGELLIKVSEVLNKK